MFQDTIKRNCMLMLSDFWYKYCFNFFSYSLFLSLVLVHDSFPLKNYQKIGKHISLLSPFFSGYAFLLFQDESSVQALIDACIEEDGKLYLCVSSPTIKDKPVSTV